MKFSLASTVRTRIAGLMADDCVARLVTKHNVAASGMTPYAEDHLRGNLLEWTAFVRELPAEERRHFLFLVRFQFREKWRKDVAGPRSVREYVAAVKKHKEEVAA